MSRPHWPGFCVIVLCVTVISLVLAAVPTVAADDIEARIARSSSGASSTDKSHDSGGSTAQTDSSNEKKAETGGEKKSEDGEDAKSDESKADEEEEPAVITRPTEWDGPSTTERMEEQLDSDGLVHFNLQGVPWPELLRWLADVSHLSLDWQELPADYLNLRTQHGYTVEEARDVINRHLLARGFTLLKRGELLTVANLEKLNSGLVPRVAPEDLDEHMPHEFVKVSFPLDWLLAEQAVEELKPMLSPNGKLTALTSTNRLEAIDAVVNLREIRNVLVEEQSGTGEENLVKVFHLEHVRAGDILPLVEQIIGLENHRNITGGVSDSSARQILQQMQQLQRLVQRNQSNSSGSSGGNGGDESKPKLIVNERENSIVAVAPPDKMEIIKQTIEALDTPSRRKGHLLANPHNLKVHRLSTLDPAPLVSVLNELGDLSPQTRIEVDDANKSLIVYGSLADQVTVQSLVDKLDGSTRNFHVIPLRRLRAEEVAGTIQYLLSAEDDEDNDRSGYYSYYSYRYSGYGSQQEKEKRPFRVDADIENNRLMLWANEVEREEVWDLLVKMGEVPSERRNNETMRVLEFSTDAEAEQVLERIRRLWPNIAPNELEIEPQPNSSEDDEGSPDGEPSTASPTVLHAPAASDSQAATPTASADIGAGSFTTGLTLGGRVSSAAEGPAITDPGLPVGQTRPPRRFEAILAEAESQRQQFVADVDATSESAQDDVAAGDSLLADRSTAVDARSAERSASEQTSPGSELEPGRSTGASQSDVEAPPIVIQRGPDGRIILGSPDTEALNRLEDLVADLTPKRSDYVIFKLKHPTTWAYDVEYNLKAFFEVEDQEPIAGYWGYYNPREETSSRLSQRRPLKIIGDEVSRTILVQGATPEQLRTIEELIEIYDRPEQSNPQMVRQVQIFQVKYSDAQTIANTVKDTFRDYLSPNDPILQQNRDDDRSESKGTTITYDYGSGRYGADEDDESNRPEPFRYKGLLSLGVDDVSNTIVVSAVAGLMKNIGPMIEELDKLGRAANNIQVVPVDSAINLNALQERMAPVLQVTRPDPTAPNGQPEAPPPPEWNGDRGGFNSGIRFGR